MQRIREENINTPAQWDAFYGGVDAEREHIWNEPYLPNEFANRFPRGAHAIDMGAGSSIGLRRIAKLRPDLRWSAAEHSLEALAHMDALVFPWVSLHHVDLNARPLPFANKQFDVVLCTEVIEHLNDPESAVAEFRRIARKMVAITCPFENAIDTGFHVWKIGQADMETFFAGAQNVEIIRTRGGQILATFATL